MDADERADLRQRVQSQVGCIGYLGGVYPSEVMWLLDALDAAEAKLAAVRRIAFDADMISALEYGRVGSPPNVDGLSQGEALGYGVDALRDIRATLSDPALGAADDGLSVPPKSPQSSGT